MLLLEPCSFKDSGIYGGGKWSVKKYSRLFINIDKLRRKIFANKMVKGITLFCLSVPKIHPRLLDRYHYCYTVFTFNIYMMLKRVKGWK